MKFFIPRCLTKLNCTGYSFAMYLKFLQSTLEGPTVGFVFSSGGQNRRVTFGGVALLISRGHLVLHFRRREGAKRWVARTDIRGHGNKWIHVAGTWSLDGWMKLYIDGALNSTGIEYTYALVDPDLPNTMYVGRVNHTEFRYGQFVLDEWYMWDQGLNGDQVMEVFASYQPGTHTFQYF